MDFGGRHHTHGRKFEPPQEMVNSFKETNWQNATQRQKQVHFAFVQGKPTHKGRDQENHDGQKTLSYHREDFVKN